jgi:hypothetical protein
MRPLRLKYRATKEFKGVTVLQYGIDPTELLTQRAYAPNEEFYQNGTNGVFNITKALLTVPMYPSKGRFVDADPAVTDILNITYLDSNRLDTEILIEPISGFAFQDTIRPQINFKIAPMPNMPNPQTGLFDATWMSELRETIVPVVWLDLEGGISDADAETFVGQVYGALFLIMLSRYGGIVLGSLLTLLSLVMLTWVYKKWRPALDHETTNLLANKRPKGSVGGETSDSTHGIDPLIQPSAPISFTPSSPIRPVTSNDLDISYHEA